MNHKQMIRVLDSMLAEMDLAIIKAKAQLEYIDEDLIRIGYEEDTVSGDLMRERKMSLIRKYSEEIKNSPCFKSNSTPSRIKFRTSIKKPNNCLVFFG